MPFSSRKTSFLPRNQISSSTLISLQALSRQHCKTEYRSACYLYSIQTTRLCHPLFVPSLIVHRCTQGLPSPPFIPLLPAYHPYDRQDLMLIETVRVLPVKVYKHRGGALEDTSASQPGYRSFPSDELLERLPRLDALFEFVGYCRLALEPAYCAFALQHPEDLFKKIYIARSSRVEFERAPLQCLLLTHAVPQGG